MTKILHLQSTFDFGKYKKKTVQDIATKDPKYILWNIENNKDVFIEAEVIAYCKFTLPTFQLSNEAAKRWSNFHRKGYNMAVNELQKKGRLLDVTPHVFVHVGEGMQMSLNF